MENVVLIVHVVVALIIIGLILIQQGKGAEAGASFGAGASQTVFGSQGGGNFFSRLTAIFATVFFVTSLGLAFLAHQNSDTNIDANLPQVPAAEEQVGPANELPEAESDIPQLEEDLEAGDVPQAPAESGESQDPAAGQNSDSEEQQ
ncbi:preprotein translocase subunit SecG [Microbulbifer variabilis]|uniref:preprotein translocase subunit SecG n=1 Tax=Microbulbifer variabilis TaxID=266805 RepID=UPI001CFDCB68|nr:preprotein translocase subunit SecG [Microbulbifer variabilis]